MIFSNKSDKSYDIKACINFSLSLLIAAFQEYPFNLKKTENQKNNFTKELTIYT